jgi:O-antigen/teichoic acid export membrane protein
MLVAIHGSIVLSSLRVRLESVWRLIRAAPENLSTEEGRARDRERRALLTTATSLVGRAVDLALAILSVRLTVSYLGAERYGLWMTVISFFSMLAFADLGLGNGLLTAVARASAHESHEEARVAVSSAFAMLCGIAALLGAAYAVASHFVGWATVFHVADARAVLEAPAVVFVLAACFILNLPLGVVPRVQAGRQEGYATNVWTIVGNLVALVGLCAGVALGAGLPALVLAIAGGPLLATALNALVSFAGRHRDFVPHPRFVRWPAASALLQTGLQFTVMQICIGIVYSSSNVIVAREMGAGDVAPYAVTSRLFGFPIQLLVMALAPIWPAYSEAVARGDAAWTRATFRKSLALGAAFTALSGAGLVVLGRPLVRLWTHGAVEPSYGLLVAMLGWNLTVAFGSALSTFLNAVNALRVQVITSIVLTFIGTAARLFFCRWYGPTGMVWGTTLSYLLVVMLPTVLESRRQLAMLPGSAAARGPEALACAEKP